MTLNELLKLLDNLKKEHHLSGDEEVRMDHYFEDGSPGMEFLNVTNVELVDVVFEKNKVVLCQEQ